MVGDLADATFVKELATRSIETFGRLDALVNNAGIYASSKVEDMDIDKWDETLAVNVRAPMLLSKHCVKELIKQESSAVVNIASGAALFGVGKMSAYCASKHALLGFSRSFYEEVREDGVKVVTLCPGFVRTEMVASRPTLDNSKMITPEDMAQTVAYILDLSPNACPVEMTMRPQKSCYV